ncbi:Phenylalanyl-tRNA synthetase, beta subunit, cytoplasmic [Polyrhizophydium stewartii]|uniref:phenylalanine--tRNA ligase n=1 Tax=Polyrhizophydium stewartii TaxID=2732419 RepID=A0ABR4NHQ0_9FUNG
MVAPEASERDTYQALVLELLDAHGAIEDTARLSVPGAAGQPAVPVNQIELLGVLNALLSREILKYEPIVVERWILTPEGAEVAKDGSHEARVFNAVPAGAEGISIPEAIVGAAAAKFGQGAAFKAKWIGKNSTGRLVRLVESIVDQTQVDLKEIQNTGSHPDDALLKALRKRQLITTQKMTSYKVTKGDNFTTTIVEESTDISHEMLASGAWKTATFKKYNFAAAGVMPPSGHLHPLLKVRDEFRAIFLEMGFSEMPTNKYVESSFWNFDALFQPQQHPARDSHDTFFLSEPATTDRFPADYLERVKDVHSNGGYGSIGYGYQWDPKEASKLVLRTHTTAISSNLLYQLAQQKEFKPVKWFSIDKVFRNETLDATHLAEFHQIEGVIADRGLTLGNLIGVLHGFFKKLGMEKLRFKPAYNPYTEPSMEIFAWHDGLGKWVEIGNSGMFRPEMLLPMGLPEDVSVIAWGLSTERPTMIKYGINNIRELVGHKLDLDMVARNPICRQALREIAFFCARGCGS